MPAFSKPESDANTGMHLKRRTCLSSLAGLGLVAAMPGLAGAQTLHLARHRGKLVYLDFWASWCGPCQQSFPWLAQMHDKYYEQGLRIVAVNLDRNRAAAERFLARLPAPFEVVFDPEGVQAERFGVSGMPHSFLIARDGRLLSNHIGFLTGEQAPREAAIVAALETNT